MRRASISGLIQTVLFWIAFAIVTLTTRRISKVARSERRGKLIASGLENLPAEGSFVLASNHFKSGRMLEPPLAVMRALLPARESQVDNMLFVVGQRDRKPPGNIIARSVKAVVEFVFRRWSRHIVRIPLGNAQMSIKSLREWRDRAERQVTFVFPEGWARKEFAAIRPGAGQWLRAFAKPVVPVGMWLDGETWHVSFGKPIKWSQRAELHDVQLGLSIAQLLPAAVAPDWQDILRRWKNVRQSRATAQDSSPSESRLIN